MKKIIVSLFVALLSTTYLFAQTPQAINYQSVIRNAAGDIIKNQAVRLRLSITEGASGVTVYAETHQATTSNIGLINLTIGNGIAVSGTFSTINWGTAQKFLKVEVDMTGGTNFIPMGSQAFVSVPYTLYAEKAGNAWQLQGNSATATQVLGTTNAQDLQLMTNNTVKAVLKSNGQLGLGTSSPDAWFSIEKNSSTLTNPDGRNFLTLKNTSTGSDATATLRIFAGTGSSSTTLNHHSAAYNVVADYANFGQLNNNGAGLILQAANTEGVVKFQTGGISERMRLDKIGNLGIGTAAPLSKLHIEGDGNGETPAGAPDNRRFIYVNNTSNSQYATAYAQFKSGSSNASTTLAQHGNNYFFNELSDFGQLWSTGNKGLVLRASPATPNEPDNAMIKFMTGYKTGGSSFERMVINAVGDVGIGTLAPVAKLHLEANGDGNNPVGAPDNRRFIYVNNTSTSQYATAYALFKSGTSGANTTIAQHGADYFIPEFADFGQIWTSGNKGLVLRASPATAGEPDNGVIKFMTGFKTGGSSNERMLITAKGDVGIGTSAPKAKVEVANGDVFVSDPTKGIILKSPNGNCWRVTVDNTGNFVRTAIACPN